MFTLHMVFFIFYFFIKLYNIFNIIADGTPSKVHISSTYSAATNFFQSSFSCDSANDNICYFITRLTVDDFQAGRIDFSSLDSITLSDLPDSDYYLSSIAALNDQQVIVAGFSSIDRDHTFYRYNFTSDRIDWAVQAGSLGKAF